MEYYNENYEGNYYEPTIADEIFEEYKIKMKDALLESIKQDIADLKYTNKKLIDENKILKEKEQEVRQKEKELEYMKSNLKWEVKRERLSELMEDFRVVMYKTNYNSELLPKCDKCNKNRQIEFLSPTGKLTYEDCECKKYKKTYKPQEYICTEFKVSSNAGCMLMWYKENHESDYDYYSYNSSDLCEKVYKKEMDYKDLNSYQTYFKTKEECQNYCDWLNEIEMNNINSKQK